MSDTPVIATHSLAVGYGGTAVLSDLCLSLEKGQMVGLLGANGTGKSTLLRTLSGHQRPVAGCIEYGGLEGRGPSALARLISIVYTDRTLAGALTVRQLVSLGRQPYTGLLGRLSADDRARVTDAMDLTGIGHKADTYMASLSDGERQKAMIARALAQDTPAILLDEPTTYLDVASRLDVFALLRQLSRQGKAILLSTHEIAPALDVCDLVWVLPPCAGTVIEASPAQMRASGDYTPIADLFPGHDIRTIIHNS